MYHISLQANVIIKEPKKQCNKFVNPCYCFLIYSSKYKKPEPANF